MKKGCHAFLFCSRGETNDSSVEEKGIVEESKQKEESQWGKGLCNFRNPLNFKKRPGSSANLVTTSSSGTFQIQLASQLNMINFHQVSS